MARAPRWRVDLSPVGWWVLARGLPTAHPDVRAALDDEPFQELIGEAEHHRFVGLLVDAVASGDLPASTAQAAVLAEAEDRLTLARVQQEACLLLVAEALDRVGIRFQLLKGMAHAELDYPDPIQRPTGDIDLLVPAEHLVEAVTCVEALDGVRIETEPTPGYNRHLCKSIAVVILDGRMEVDLHRTLIGGPFGARLPADGPRPAVRPVQIAGRVFDTPAVEEALMLASFHLVIEGYKRAVSLRDVAQLVVHPDLDAPRAVALARRWRAEAPLSAALLMTRRDLRLPWTLPLMGWAEGHRNRALDLLWLRAERPDEVWPWTRTVGTFLDLPSWYHRTIFARAMLRPTPGTWPTLGEHLTKKYREVRARLGVRA